MLIVRTSDKIIVHKAIFRGVEMPVKGDVIVINGIHWTVVSREYILAEETWVLEVM